MLLLKADGEGSGFYRVSEPARVARLAGVAVSVAPSVNVDARRDNATGLHDVRELFTDADVVSFQRPLQQAMYATAVAAKRQGIGVVVELDDDFHAVHRRNVAYRAVDPRHDRLHNRDWLTKTIELADVVTVSTPALRRYAPDRAVVVRNRLPESALALAPVVSMARHTVGWTGWLKTHPEDMQATAGGLRGVVSDFAVIGDHRGIADALQLPNSAVRLASEWVQSLPVYWARIAEHVGVGIAPLELSAFNMAKSDLKIREMTSLGVPFVASPTSGYKRLVAESGCGFIAGARGQWGRRVKTLLTDDAVYEVHRQRGLAWAATQTIEQHADEWVTAWARAADRVPNERVTV